jgi:hypothetical protein
MIFEIEGIAIVGIGFVSGRGRCIGNTIVAKHSGALLHRAGACHVLSYRAGLSRVIANAAWEGEEISPHQ